MELLVLALVKKAAPYLLLAAMSLTLGGYCGYRLEANALVAAKAELSAQQAKDAMAAAAANAAASAALAKADARANAAEVQLAAADRQVNLSGAALAAQVASEAIEPGQDAADAPVLAHTLDALEGIP